MFGKTAVHSNRISLSFFYTKFLIVIELIVREQKMSEDSIILFQFIGIIRLISEAFFLLCLRVVIAVSLYFKLISRQIPFYCKPLQRDDLI